ncbi:MAG: xanthine dehydrogenase family protein molybdopterin-binding subunit [Hyphomicrobiales bacterium]|nr:xanthine dehydrogenase family protein molybdopterin-binding subunit [Hyphomicrobiales bacterium]
MIRTKGAEEGATDPWVGRSIKRKEDLRLIRGQGRYLADMKLPGMVHAFFVRSKYAHARITSIDVSRARAVPGVVAVFTGADLLKLGMRELLIPPLIPELPGVLRIPPSMPLAVDKVVFHGEPIAVVLAESKYASEDAAELVAVNYEPLVVVGGVEQAMQADAPRVYEDWPDNFLYQAKMGGDASDAFARADIIVEERFEVPRTGASPMELRGVLTQWDDHSGLTHWTTTQRPHLLRQAISQVLEWPEDMVRVIAPKDQGGSFGTKAPHSREDFVLALITRDVKRPVRWVESREESFRAGVGQERAQIHEIQLAARKDGTILGLRDRCIADVGGGQQPVFMGIGYARAGCFLMSSFYDIPQVEIEILGVVTNKPCLTPSRAFGSFPVRLAIDGAIHRLARELGLDPLDVVRKNLVTEFPYVTATGNFLDSGDFVGGFDKLIETIDVVSMRQMQAELREQGRYIGLGFGGEVERSGVSSEAYVPRQRKPGYGVATVKVLNSGKIHVLIGDPPSGQSHETAISQVLADEFGVTPDDVRLDYGDTLNTPYGMGNVGNRMASYTVSAAVIAARELKKKMGIVASHDLGVDASTEEFIFENGNIIWSKNPDKRITLRAISEHLIERPIKLPQGTQPGLEHTAYYEPKDVPNMTGASFHAAVLEVMPETGMIKILRYIVVDDCGRPINPLVVEGQVQGGVVMGIGNTIFEEFVYNERGELQNGTLEGYMMPCAADVPHVETYDHSVPTPNNPLGTKGKGEGAPAPVSGALINAVEDALRPLGIRITTLPLKPERIRSAIAAVLSPHEETEEVHWMEPAVREFGGEGEGYDILAEMYRFYDGIQISLQPTWHPYVGQIRGWLRDFDQLLDRVARSPRTLDVLVQMFSGEREFVFEQEADAQLKAQWGRLQSLPRPDGGHAYLDYIIPALESHEMLLIACSNAPDEDEAPLVN